MFQIPHRHFVISIPSIIWPYLKQDRSLWKAYMDSAIDTYNKYDGFYVWVHKAGRIKNPKLIAKYLGRYVRHPAIANSRLIYFNGKDVGFFYEEHKEEQIIRHDVTLQVDDFISALLQHIPEPQFKMIRYYGAYARRTKKIFKSYLQSSIKQLALWTFGFRKEIRCPFCGGEVEFVWYCKKPPPQKIKSQRELLNWISSNSIEFGKN